MENACTLWTELHPSGRRASGESHVFLQFRRSNLLVRLPGPRPGDELDEVVLRETDALGLGLRADDFEDGVVVCRDDAPDEMLGWRCHAVRVIGLADDGTTTELGGARAAAGWLDHN